MIALSPRLLWWCALCLGATALVAAGWTWVAAANQQRTQDQRLFRIAAHADTLRDLDANLPAWTRLPKPGPLAPEIGATLSAAGLPASAMSSLSADPDSPSNPQPGDSIKVRSRRATLVLASVTLPQLGDFLSRWRTRQPAWTISAIDLAPESGAAAAKSQTGGDLPLHAVLTLETLSLERPGGTR